MAETTAIADPDAEALPPPPASGAKSLIKWAAVIVALTLVAAGLGGGLGIKLAQHVEDALRARDQAEEKPAATLNYTLPTHLKALTPIVTNLASPPDTWIRIEAAIVFDDEEIASDDVLVGEIGQDMLAYLRTVSLPQIEGPSGMQHLREDLIERARIRSENRVSSVVFQTMVVQ